MWRSRIFWRLAIAYGLLILGAVAAVGVLVLNRAEAYLLQQIEESLRTRAVLVREAVAAEGTGALEARVRALGQEIGTRITLIAADGGVLADSDEDPARMENHANRPEVREALAVSAGSATRYSRTLDRNMMYVALKSTGPAAVVRVALPLDEVQDRLAVLQRMVWTAAAGTGLAALLLAFALARRTARPIDELTEGAEKIAAGAFGHRVYAISRDEVGTLAAAFNRMSERLATQFAQLEEDRQQLRTILSGMVEGVIALDAEQRVVFANERAARLLDLSPQAASGRKLWEVVRQRPLQEVVERALAQPEPCRDELSWAGSPPRQLTVHAARLPGAPPRGVVLVLHDTTELRRLERLRQEFVANVSHELKTPLAVIRACVETLAEGAADDREARERFLGRIGEQAGRLHALILDLLSLARVESGEEAFEMAAVPLGSAVGACLERHRARADAKGQRLEAVAPEPGGDVAAWADAEAVGQILDNLVDNAVKYTSDGGTIRVGWRVEGAQVCLTVQDTGIGIPEQDLPRIFERFYRVDKARSRELGGTGLGLSIVKHLTQAMHGQVEAVSKSGQGTTFLVRLPKAP